MNNSSTFRQRNPNTNSLNYLITRGLGYCCEYFFFSRFTDTELIAARLGVSERAVRKRKQLLREGKIQCLNCERCLKSRLPG